MKYMECLGKSFPNVSAVCFGDPDVYEDIVWEGGDPLPAKAVLEAQILANLKIDKVTELSQACELEIISGFTSDALGTPAIYDSETVDQLNLIGAASATAPMEGMPEGFSGPYAVRPIVEGVVQPKRYEMHSYAQLRAVLQSGFFFKLVRLQKFNDKRDYVNNVAATIEAVEAVSWTSVEPVPG
jgi:hypothetical protein